MSEILRLAEELRETPSREASDSYSLAEIQTVAGEMGMDPSQIAVAAAQYEYGRRQGEKADRWRQLFVREVPFPVSDAGWERIVDEVRSLVGVSGTFRERADGSREWMSIANGETVVVTVTSHSTSSQINLMVNRRDAGLLPWVFFFIAFFLTSMMGFGIASKGGFTGYDLIPVFSLLLAETIAVFVGLNASSKRAENRFKTLADNLEAAALSGQTQASSSVLSVEPVVVDHLHA